MNAFTKIVQPAVDKWFTEQCHNPWARMYLYYKPMAEEIVITEDCPEGYELAWNERISTGWTKEVAAYKITEILRRLPSLKV